MFVDDDVEYFAQRERVERCLAANATNDAARSAHLALASEYRRKALATGYNTGAPAFFTSIAQDLEPIGACTDSYIDSRTSNAQQ